MARSAELLLVEAQGYQRDRGYRQLHGIRLAREALAQEAQLGRRWLIHFSQH